MKLIRFGEPGRERPGLQLDGGERIDAIAIRQLQTRALLPRLTESNELHATSTPPSMGYACPVTNAASSEQRYNARCATSSGVPIRPIG